MSPSITRCLLQCAAETGDLTMPQSKEDKDVRVLKNVGEVQKVLPQKLTNTRVAMNVVNRMRVICRHTTEDSRCIFLPVIMASLSKRSVSNTTVMTTFARNELYLLWHVLKRSCNGYRAATSAQDRIQKHTCFIGTDQTPRGGHNEKCPSGSGEHFSTVSQQFALEAWVKWQAAAQAVLYKHWEQHNLNTLHSERGLNWIILCSKQPTIRYCLRPTNRLHLSADLETRGQQHCIHDKHVHDLIVKIKEKMAQKVSSENMAIHFVKQCVQLAWGDKLNIENLMNVGLQHPTWYSCLGKQPAVTTETLAVFGQLLLR